MNKKLSAVAEPGGDGMWCVTVTEDDNGKQHFVIIDAPTEKDAVFKAMEQVNDQ